MKQAQYKITKGMNQDIEMQSASPDSAFKLLNIKNQILDSIDGEALTNEKGTSQCIMNVSNIQNIANTYSIEGKILGIIQCNSNLVVLFVKTLQNIDRIYKISCKENNSIQIKLIAEGTFNIGDKVKGIYCFENSELQKVYWIDGVNQLRYINMAESNKKIPITEEIYLNTSPEYKMNHTIQVERTSGGGIFTAGTLQYAFTYYMKHGAETGIVDVTPLYYIGEEDRGIAADETVGCSYKITIQNPDTRYDYIRLYSIQRRELNGQPVVKIVKDINLH